MITDTEIKKTVRARTANGKFAKPIDAYMDKVKHDLNRFKEKAEKFQRMYESVAWMNDYKDRRIKKLKDELSITQDKVRELQELISWMK